MAMARLPEQTDRAARARTEYLERLSLLAVNLTRPDQRHRLHLITDGESTSTLPDVACSLPWARSDDPDAYTRGRFTNTGEVTDG